jgi:hypothetical protein
MALVVPHDHNANGLFADFVQHVIRKAREVGPPKTLINQMKPQRSPLNSINYAAQLSAEFLSQLRRNFVIISERFGHILLYQRMVNQPHFARSRSIAAQNSSDEIGCTWPQSRPSRRRTASFSESLVASSRLCGGRESSSHAASEPRSFSGISATSSLISESDMQAQDLSSKRALVASSGLI